MVMKMLKIWVAHDVNTAVLSSGIFGILYRQSALRSYGVPII